MKTAKSHALAWAPHTDKVILLSHPGYIPPEYPCWICLDKKTFEQRKTIIFIEAYHLIVADGCDPAAVHRALWPLAEYRDGLAEDFPEPNKPLR